MSDFNYYLDSYLEKHRQQIISDLVELIKIPSIRGDADIEAPYGIFVRQALDKAIEQMDKLGYKVAVENHGSYGYCDFGTGPKVIGLIPHLDVVPANGVWKYPAFEPTILNGYVIGRGASDNKGGVIASIYAIDAIIKSGIKVKNKVRLILGCNEETDMDDMKQLVEDDLVPDFSLIPDAFFPIGVGEKGRISITMRDGNKLDAIRSFLGGKHNGTSVPDYACCKIDYSIQREKELRTLCQNTYGCSVRCDKDEITLDVMGVSAHPAMPQNGENAIWMLAHLLKDTNSLSRADRTAMEKLEKMTRGYLGENMEIAHADRLSGELTCVCIHAELIDGVIETQYNIRFCVSMDKKELERKLFVTVDRYGCLLQDISTYDAYYFPENHPLVLSLKDAYNSACGKRPEIYVHPGETYAGKLGNAVIFGNEFRKESPFGLDRGRAHQVDEATNIDDLMSAVKIYAHGILAVDRSIGGMTI